MELRGRGQASGEQKDTATLPAEEDEQLLAEGGKEHLLLYHLKSKMPVMERFLPRSVLAKNIQTNERLECYD